MAEIAEQTKIKASLLEGLERGDISQWPAGIFRRAYVRAYARAIGFDPNEAVREFLVTHPDPAVDTAPAPPPPSERLRSFVGSTLGTLLRRPPGSASAPPPAPTDTVATAGTDGDSKPLALAVLPAVRPADPPRRQEPRRQAEAPRTQEPRRQAGMSRPIEMARPAAPAEAPLSTETRKPDFLAAAKICTELGRVEDVKDVPPLLRDAAKILGARGLIVWVWDGAAEELKPALVHGYSSKVRSRLRGVAADADNVTSAAYRAAAPLARSGALAVPLLAPSACAGVLALELTDGAEQDADVRAMATFFAAILAQLVGAPPAGERREPDIAAPPRAIEAVQPG